MRKIIFIITLVLVLFLVFILFVFISNIRTAPEETVVDIPFPTESQPQITTPTPFLDEDDPLLEQIINRLPVSTDAYDIEYLSSSNTFVITIKESPFEQNSEDAQQWFLQNGVSSTENLNIIYNRYRWVE